MILLVVFTMLIEKVITVSPYLVLDLEETASHKEVIKQYKKLKKNLKKKDEKLGVLYDEAYKQIMLNNNLYGDRKNEDLEDNEGENQNTPKN